MLKNFYILLVSMVMLSACSGGQSQGKRQELVQPIKSNLKLPKIDHLIVVIEENHSNQEISGNPSAPYINSLMKRGANFTNYHAVEHPSQPNYLDIFSGSNQGVTSDWMPRSRFSAENLGSELIKKNYTFIGFSEDLPAVGYNGTTTGKGGYARKHNPWVNFTNIPRELNQPLTNFPKDFHSLPTVSFVIPNLSHDMHDGTIKEGDRWLKKHLDPYVQWARKHNSLLIVTWDEDDRSENNKIPTFFVGPMAKTGVYNEDADHFRLLRTIEDLYGLSPIGQSKYVEPIGDVWK